MLLICPSFFSYHLSIAEELRSRGFNVVWWDDRISNSSPYKLLLRLFPRWVAALSTSAFLLRVQQLDPRPIRRVLVVKGEGLSSRAVAGLRATVPHARFCLYLWDGIENAKGALSIAPLFDTVASFDPTDARRFGWRYRPLFARETAHALTSPRKADNAYDWAFIGTLHSDRYQVLRRLLKNSPTGRVFAFGFLPGKLMWILRHLTDWSMWRPGPLRISRAPLPAAEVREIFLAARAVIDIEHPQQRGLTMRTIETLLAGHKLVTTNKHIRSSDLYDSSRVCVVDRYNPAIPEEFFHSEFLPLEAQLRERYSLAGWAEDLMDQQQTHLTGPVKIESSALRTGR